MLFRQLFEPVSSTYTYLIACEESGQAILVDPVLPMWQRDLETLQNLGLRLAVTLDTHIHADHITAASRLKLETGSAIAHPAVDALTCVDWPVREGEPLRFGSVRLDPLYTPGHTDGHHAYLLGDRVLTGDTLLIDGCGRTDFQGGDAATLYRSIHDKLFSLPGETLVYPAHDYDGRRVSNIAQEKQRNPRLGDDKPLQAFVDIMASMDLPYPKFIDFALPGNRACGMCPDEIPEHLQEYCDPISSSRQG
jgi:glyoxylase-like metal-dependent hydrolase (beta-lactamase superfamily II)